MSQTPLQSLLLATLRVRQAPSSPCELRDTINTETRARSPSLSRLRRCLATLEAHGWAERVDDGWRLCD